MTNTTKGSCLCSRTTFEIVGDFESFLLCHCKYCQKDTGSAHAANLFSTTAKLKWTSGSENVKTFTLPSTRHAKSFCKECGSALPGEQMDGKLLVIPAGSIDTELTLKPTAKIFYSSCAAWSEGIEELPKIAKLPNS